MLIYAQRSCRVGVVRHTLIVGRNPSITVVFLLISHMWYESLVRLGDGFGCYLRDGALAGVHVVWIGWMTWWWHTTTNRRHEDSIWENIIKVDNFFVKKEIPSSTVYSTSPRGWQWRHGDVSEKVWWTNKSFPYLTEIFVPSSTLKTSTESAEVAGVYKRRCELQLRCKSSPHHPNHPVFHIQKTQGFYPISAINLSTTTHPFQEQSS